MNVTSSGLGGEPVRSTATTQFQYGVNHSLWGRVWSTSTTLYQLNYNSRNRPTTVTSTSTVNKIRIFRTKDKILLWRPPENKVVHTAKKKYVTNKRFVRSELAIKNRWSDSMILEFFEKIFEDKSNQTSKETEKVRHRRQYDSCQLNIQITTILAIPRRSCLVSFL